MTTVADCIDALERAYKRGDATEHSYRPALKALLESRAANIEAISDPDTWAFRVGGYQVLEKWLEDRKGRTLGIDDIVHYRRVAVALRRTRGLMLQVDECAMPLWAAEPTGATA